MMRGDQRGFNIVNLLMAAGVTFGIIMGTKAFMAYREREAATKLAAVQAERIREQFHKIMSTDASWNATLATPENQSMACLREHSSCYGHGGLIVLRDGQRRSVFDSTQPGNGFTIEGNNCGSFSESGNDICPFRLELSWRPACSDDCVDPRHVELRARILFRGGNVGLFAGVRIPDSEFTISRLTRPGIPRNCYELLQAGRTANGIYVVHPTPNAPPLSIYCDQNSHGGGWALALMATRPGYSAIPESSTVTPDFTSRLSPDLVRAYLDTSTFQNGNNLRLDLPDVAGGLVLSASTAGSIEPIAYTALMPRGECREVPEGRNEAQHHAAEIFSLFFRGAGEAGFDDTTTQLEGYRGLTACFGTTASGRHCGTGCARKWQGQLLRLRGAIWIR